MQIFNYLIKFHWIAYFERLLNWHSLNGKTIDFFVLSEFALNHFHQRQKDDFDTLRHVNEFASVLVVLGQVGDFFVSPTELVQ
jgi:hypothetical protein